MLVRTNILKKADIYRCIKERRILTTPYLGITGTKRADKILKSLGVNYRYRIIEGETCIYKPVSDIYHVLIKGVRSRSYHMNMSITLVKITDNSHSNVIEIISGIKTIEQLKKTLETVEKQAIQGYSKAISDI